MLYMIGLGLNDEKDITIKGLEAVKKCDYVFLEDYTSKLNVSKEKLEKFYGKKILLANRELVEKRADHILDKAVNKNIGFLVIGDVFSATTHVDLYLRAKSHSIDIIVINNTSILTAVGIVGLSLYNYGKITSLPFFEPSFRPESPYDVIKNNLKNALHTLVLLDVKDLKYMTINEAITQLLEIEEKKKEGFFTPDLKIIGCARLGSNDHIIKYGTVTLLQNYDFGLPLHSIIIPSNLHFMEKEMLKQWE